MLIDRKAIPWVLICLAIFAVATALYVSYAKQHDGHPSGGSWPGLAFGAAGSGAMIAAMLLAARKKVRSWQLGRTYYWMQAHVWLGLLSYPLIIYHAGGFLWGGLLTQVVMWLFTAVIVSGVVGIFLQQIIPTRLLRKVPDETIYQQIDRVLRQIREEAEAIVRPLRAQPIEVSREHLASPGGTAVATAVVLPASSANAAFEAFYARQMVPFLDEGRSPSGVTDAAFDQWTAELPAELHPPAEQLRRLVEERRQLTRQRRLHRLLHGWLLIHVPISYLLVVLAIIHAVMAFRFTSPGR